MWVLFRIHIFFTPRDILNLLMSQDLGMKNITVFGAGLSATALIDYLLEHATDYGWHITIVDRDLELLESKTQGHSCAQPLMLDITDAARLERTLQSQDIAISLLPPHLHQLIAEACISSGTHLFTASYVSQDMAALEPRIREAGLVYMCELGADPGIDHLSMVKVITELQQRGAILTDIKSMTGALVSPEDLQDCPLKYKFTWNPDNVIRAGEHGGAFVKDGYTISVDYQHLYQDVFSVEVEGLENLVCYYNRNAEPYLEKYHIPDVPNFLRGTLRYRDFVEAWDVLVQTGITASREMVDSDTHSVVDIWSQYLGTSLPIAEYLRQTYPERVSESVYDTLVWLDLSSSEVLHQGTIPLYQVLKHHLIPRLRLLPDDRDMLVMKHEVRYQLDGETYQENATMKCFGKNAHSTAISDTVGLPLAIFTRLFAIGELQLDPGLHIPTNYSLCNPILDELEDYHIRFSYETVVLSR